eukprot:scaffold915_cov65-Cylindrotheca_fusiformis.AAC.3
MMVVEPPLLQLSKKNEDTSHPQILQLHQSPSMLQSLIDAQNTEPIYVYLLHGPSEQEPLLLSAAASATKAYFVQLMNESPLPATIVEFRAHI